MKIKETESNNLESRKRLTIRLERLAVNVNDEIGIVRKTGMYNRIKMNRNQEAEKTTT